MAVSHRATDAYMAEMYRALEGMGVDTKDDPYLAAFQQSPVSSAKDLSVLRAKPKDSLPALPRDSELTQSTIMSGWKSGTISERGSTYNASERPLMCMSVFNDLVVVGGADHGLHEVDLRPCYRGLDPIRRRQLYTRAHGHSEWVTGVAHMPDGRIVSAGMDSKLCLWTPAGAPRCVDMLGHTGSISSVVTSCSNNEAIISASYDKTVRIWSVSKNKVSEASCLRIHRAPVLHLVWHGDNLASADRDGVVVSWDASSSCGRKLGGHKGQASALDAADATQHLISGGMGGDVAIWDSRSPNAIVQHQGMHRGAVNNVKWLDDGTVVTAGSDGALLLLDPRVSLNVIKSFGGHTSAIYSLFAKDGAIFSGGADGRLLVHMTDDEKPTCSLIAGANAPREIFADAHKIVSAGDDGNVVVHRNLHSGDPRNSTNNLPPKPSAVLSRHTGGKPTSSNRQTDRDVQMSQMHVAAAQPKNRTKSLSVAQQYAEKKRVAMEKAAAIRAERAAAQKEREIMRANSGTLHTG